MGDSNLRILSLLLRYPSFRHPQAAGGPDEDAEDPVDPEQMRQALAGGHCQDPVPPPGELVAVEAAASRHHDRPSSSRT